MKKKIILGKPIDEWEKKFPLLRKITDLEELFWVNPLYDHFETAQSDLSLTEKDLSDAADRFRRFAPYIEKAFPETRTQKGIIESPLVAIPEMQKKMEALQGGKIGGALLLKCDNSLPISGSIKARGGIYEVLKHAEDLALAKDMIRPDADYSAFTDSRFRSFFSKHSIAVGSTGNLGLSIGIISAKLGFKVFVHMSSDAKGWKKNLLRNMGVTVIEYASDYSRAVSEGRKQAEGDSRIHFIDDENSSDLFLGYAASAYRIREDLKTQNIKVDQDHPLFVYLPCGVGGGPGGITFGLKLLFGDSVHCFFAEPTHSPSMLLGLLTGLHNKVSVGDFGLDNKTDADGLAVGRPSGFVGKSLERVISGVFTVEDKSLYQFLKALSDTEGISTEPSAMAGMAGPMRLGNQEEGISYLKKRGLEGKMKNAAHIVWATGGSMVPLEEMAIYYSKGGN